MTPCIIWTGCRSADGYGKIHRGKRPGYHTSPHRLAYEEAYGPIPEGLQIDHLCKVTLCYNPEHLEAVTPLENSRRGSRAQMTHCKWGHPFDEANTKSRAGEGGRHVNGRRCRTCQNAAVRRYNARKRAAA